MRKILSTTGIRSEYDILYSVYQAARDFPGVEIQLAVTGAHLSEWRGNTVEQIKKDGFSIAGCIPSLQEGDRDIDRLSGISVQLKGLSQLAYDVRPDILLSFGDREESLTTAIVGSYLNIPVAHISGGDRVIGNVDDHVRHAVTKLSHIHFTTSEDSKNRILKMGEQPFRVFNTGNPGLDRLLTAENMSRGELLSWYGFSQESWDKPLILVIQHVLSSEISHAYEQMKITMEALKDFGANVVVSYPNSDAGSRELIRCIQEYDNLPYVRTYKNIPRVPFINTMRHASCMLGNSSSGLLEAPFLKLPAINVGNRQKARLHADNVIFVGHSIAEIRDALNRACWDKDFRAKVDGCANFFGDGQSGKRIVEILANIAINENLLNKDVTY